MEMSATATFRTTPEMKARITAIAKETNKSASFYYNQMLSEYLEELEDLQDAIKISKEIDEGKTKTYTLEEVKREFGL